MIIPLPLAPLAFLRSTGGAFTFGRSVFDILADNSPYLDNHGPHPKNLELGSGTLVPSTPWRGDHRHHYDRQTICLWEDQASSGKIWLGKNTCSPASSSNDNPVKLPFGRARGCPRLHSTPCPTTVTETQHATKMAQKYNEQSYREFVASHPNESAASNPSQRQTPHWIPFCQLAVVGLVLDAQREHLLITRRPAHMRSFPEAWVLPGGSVHEGETLGQAISREVQEETGLVCPTADWALESLWESVFPTIPKHGEPIRRHHLVVFLSATLSKDQELDLCPEEVDGAVWISHAQMEDVIRHTHCPSIDMSQLTPLSLVGPQEQRPCGSPTRNDMGAKSTANVSLRELAGIYPQDLRPDTLDDCRSIATTARVGGLGQGTLFAIEEFAQTWSKLRRTRKDARN